MLNFVNRVPLESSLLLFLLDLVALLFALDLGLVLEVLRQIALLAHSLRVKQPVFVRALCGILVAPHFPVAGRAHVFGVVLAVRVRALGDRHHEGVLRGRCR